VYLLNICFLICFHFHKVPSLLACLNTIRQDNTQLQDNVAGLTEVAPVTERRDRLLTANARSSDPLIVQTVTQAPFMANSDSNRLDDETSTLGLGFLCLSLFLNLNNS